MKRFLVALVLAAAAARAQSPQIGGPQVQITLPNSGGGGSGTVTSVGLSLPSIFTVSGTPVTISGTLTGSLNTESSNLFFAGPASGAAATPTFRSLAYQDLGMTTAGDLIYANATPALARLGIGSAHQYLAAGSGLPAWTQPGFGDLSGSIALGQTPLTTAGDLIYANATPALARLAIGSAGQFLGISGGLPAWTNTLLDQAETIVANQADTTKKLEWNLANMTTGNTIVAYLGGTSASPTWGTSANQWATVYTLALSDGTASIPLSHSGAIPILGPAGGNPFYIAADILTANYSAAILTANGGSLMASNAGRLCFSSSGANALSDSSTCDTMFTRAAAASFQLGAADAAAPVAQSFQAQSVVGGTTNTPGANWTLNTSKGTGTGNPGLLLLASAPPGATGSTQNIPVTADAIGGFLVLANSTATTIAQLTVASNTTAQAHVKYACTVTNGTDEQAITGETNCSVTNKAGTIANNTCATPVIATNPATSGTLTATVAITAANPALLQLTCTSSLTPSTGYPLARYDVTNLGWQAITVTQ